MPPTASAYGPMRHQPREATSAREGERVQDPLASFLTPVALLAGLAAGVYLADGSSILFWLTVFLVPFALIFLMDV